MASLDEPIDVDAALDRELDTWFEKWAAENGIEANRRDDAFAAKLDVELLKNWKASGDPNDFDALWTHQQRFIQPAWRTMKWQNNELPRSAINAEILKEYSRAVGSYNPDGGSSMRSWVLTNLRHVNRFINTYNNMGRIPPARAQHITAYQESLRELSDRLGRSPTAAEIADHMQMSIDEVKQTNEKITPATVKLIQKELRRDLVADSAAAVDQQFSTDDRMQEYATYLHPTLSKEQQLVLEHTFPNWGRPTYMDPGELGRQVNMSPQKVRAMRKQIFEKLLPYYGSNR